MNVVIMGCGRLGERVAKKMDKADNVIIIDRNPDALKKLGKDFRGKVMQADGTDMSIYNVIMEPQADLFLALTNSDNSNIMAAEIAGQKYKVKTVIARVDDPIRAKAFEELGIQTFCPTTLSEKRINKMVEASKKTDEKGDDDEN